LASTSNFKKRVIAAGSWSVGGHVFSQLIRLGSNLLMTRLLTPDAFGLLAIVIVLMVGLTLFSDFGLSQNIVRSPNASNPAFLNTVWTLQIVQGCAIYLVALATVVAIWVLNEHGLVKSGTVYADPQLPWIIAIYALCSVIQGLTSTKIPLLRRDLKLKQIALLELTNQGVALVVMIPLAYLTRSVWALVIGGLVSSITGMILSHTVFQGQRNKLCWNTQFIKEIFGFGRWIFLGSILGFLVLSGDRLLLSILIDSKSLGIYMIAFLLANAVQNLFQAFGGTVVFSALSEVLRDRPQYFGSVVDKFQRISDLMLLTTCGFLMVASPAIVALLYDPRYHEAGMMLSILGLGMVGIRYHMMDQCYAAVGRPGLIATSNAIRLVGLIFFTIVGFRLYGVIGALFGIALSQYSIWPLAIYFRYQRKLSNWKTEVLLIPELVIGGGLGYLFLIFSPTRNSLIKLI
jgi:O-antigen/teichoic acid export membrane protein